MPRLTSPKRAAIRQALEMQDSFTECVKVLKADFLNSTNKGERARIATAMGALGGKWTNLQETIRILKGQPLPGSLSHEKVRPRRPRRPGGGSIVVANYIAEHSEEPAEPPAPETGS